VKNVMKVRAWRRISTCLLGLALSVALLSACHGPLASGDDTPVATVNGQPITEGALRQALLGQVGPHVLVEMIDERLIRQTATVQGLTVDPAEMKLRLENAVSQAGGEAGFRQNLAAQGLTE